jgi:CDGSH-type Zn-finger protein
MNAFNQLYSDMLRALHRAFNGAPAEIAATIDPMHALRRQAQELMQMPSGDGLTTAGPSFEWMPPVQASASAARTPCAITVEQDGPLVVEGGVPITRKSIVYSEWHEPMTWRKDATLPTRERYRLCRCGQSAHKPYCDSTHRRARFDGTETAPTEPSVTRQRPVSGPHITVTDDQMLCTHAGFCGNRKEKVWDQIPRAGDSLVRFDLIQRLERCPSGRLSYELEDGPVEPDHGRAIAVTKDGPYWVTGEIPVTLSDGRTLEVRNRVMLCRCGQSANKPLCDGSHRAAKFRDG